MNLFRKWCSQSSQKSQDLASIHSPQAVEIIREETNVNMLLKFSEIYLHNNFRTVAKVWYLCCFSNSFRGKEREQVCELIFFCFDWFLVINFFRFDLKPPIALKRKIREI